VAAEAAVEEAAVMAAMAEEVEEGAAVCLSCSEEVAVVEAVAEGAIKARTALKSVSIVARHPTPGSSPDNRIAKA
jgi:H2-forming N5,N10-methylenetetrahydromethanopterin dehydrogenase-like enzyme